MGGRRSPGDARGVERDVGTRPAVVQGAAPSGAGGRAPAGALALAAVLAAFVLLPRVASQPALRATFLGAASFLAAWAALLAVRFRARGRTFEVERGLVSRQHYVQACVQLSIYAYWGWYWRPVYEQAPLIVAQVVFLYAFDALLSWSRGRPWRLGFGPLPIILSTNVFIWFVDGWFALQFLMIAVGALGKEFIRWTRDGRRTHVFNPSAFTLCLFSLVLIATNTTHLTTGIEIASTLAAPPHIYLWVVVVGLVVQWFFAVTLMTVSAALVLLLLGAAYGAATGTYFFVDTNLPIAIFLGLHLLVTDPSTSPRTNVGRVIFGGLYGLGNFVLYAVLERYGVPEFYDKLLPVPLLNLSVRWIDRLARGGPLGRIAAWEARRSPRALNLAHMGAWVAVCAPMLATGYLGGAHEGASIAYWKRAVEEGRVGAEPRLIKVVGAQADGGSAEACNEFGRIKAAGKLVPVDRAAAAHYFARACELGLLEGCDNVATQFLFLREARSSADVARALDALERAAAVDGRASFLLGLAHETGRGRPREPQRAHALYRQGCALSDPDACKGCARVGAPTGGTPEEVRWAASVLERACEAGDADACLYLAHLCRSPGAPALGPRAVSDLLARACALGSPEACAALQRPDGPGGAGALGALGVRQPAWR